MDVGNSLLAKAVSCSVSVVKANCVPSRALQIVLAVFYPCFIHLWTFAKPRGVANAFKAIISPAKRE